MAGSVFKPSYSRSNPAPQGQGAGVLKPANGGGNVGAGAGFNPGAYAMGELLRLYNDPGQYIPGSAGTPGYTVSRAGERAAAQAAYDQGEANRKSLYGQVDRDIRGRKAAIEAGYAKGTADLRANTQARAQAASSAASSRDADVASAAARMGLPVTPPTQGTLSDQVAQDYAAKQNANTEAWAGFNGGAAQRAVERNDAIGDAFIWQGDQQRQAMLEMLTQALAGLQDTYVAGSGGSAGRYSGGLTNSQKLNALGRVIGYDDKQFDNDLAAQKFAFSTQPSTTTTRNSSGKVTTSVTSRGR